MTWMFQRIQENGIRSAIDYQDNQWVEVCPILKGMDIPLSKVGTAISSPYGSGDDFFGTLPKDMAAIPPVEIWFTPFPPQAHSVLREQALRVLEENVDPEDAINTFYKMISNSPNELLTLPDDFNLNTRMWVRAVGNKDGRAARSTCWFTTHMWNLRGYFLTSVALVTAAFKVLRGEIGEHGVFTAEKAFDPQSFFNEVVTILPTTPFREKIIDELFEWLD